MVIPYGWPCPCRIHAMQDSSYGSSEKTSCRAWTAVGKKMKSSDGRKNTTLLRHTADGFTITVKSCHVSDGLGYFFVCPPSDLRIGPGKNVAGRWRLMRLRCWYQIHSIISQNQNPEPSKRVSKHHPQTTTTTTQSNNNTTKKYKNVQTDFHFPQKALQS